MKRSKNTLFNVLIIILIIIAGIYWMQNSKTLTKGKSTAIENRASVTFMELSPKKLNEMLAKKDFTLIDVHIPEQVHIPKTDFMIPYNKIDDLVAALPDKNAKIVLYCRSGGMSKMAAKALIKRGYTNVFSLTNGMNGWMSAGMKTMPKGSMTVKNSLKK